MTKKLSFWEDWCSGGLVILGTRRALSTAGCCWSIFGFDEKSRALKSNAEKEVEDQGDEKEDLTKEETTVFRGLAARLSFMSLDCPDIQFPGKAASREMAIDRLRRRYEVI